MATQASGDARPTGTQLIAGASGTQPASPNGTGNGVALVPMTIGPGASPALVGASLAFAVGWQMTELHNALPAVPTTTATVQRLPGLGKLKDTRGGAMLFLGQMETKLDRPELCLRPNQRRQLKVLVKAVRDAANVRDERPDTESTTTYESAVLKLHGEMAVGLITVDYKLAKAYALGVRLAWVTQWPARGWKRAAPSQANGHTGGAETPQALAEEAAEPSMPGSGRIEKTIQQLGDLATVLPRHASRSVALSLAAWSDWNERRAQQKLPLTLAQAVTLARQGEIWRSLLSGEKAAQDMLDLPDYELAANQTFRRSSAIARKFVWAHRWAVVVLLGITAGAIALIILDNGAPQVWAGVVGILASAGVTWKAVSTALGSVAVELGKPVWGAEIDVVLAQAMTKLPPEETKNDYDGFAPRPVVVPTVTTEPPPPSSGAMPASAPAPDAPAAGPPPVSASAPPPPARGGRRRRRARAARTPEGPNWERILADHPPSR